MSYNHYLSMKGIYCLVYIVKQIVNIICILLAFIQIYKTITAIPQNEAPALNLYRSFGFAPTFEVEYWRVSVHDCL